MSGLKALKALIKGRRHNDVQRRQQRSFVNPLSTPVQNFAFFSLLAGKVFMANRSANRRVTDPRLGTENHKKRDLSGECQSDLLVFCQKDQRDCNYKKDDRDQKDCRYRKL